MNRLKRLRTDQWAWVHAKVALIVWGVLYILSTPQSSVYSIGSTLNYIVGIFVILGSAMSIVGMYISTDEHNFIRHKGLTVELSGLIFAFCGPMTYFTAQIALLHNKTYGPSSTARAFLGYAMASFILVRIVMVGKALKKKAR